MTEVRQRQKPAKAAPVPPSTVSTSGTNAKKSKRTSQKTSRKLTWKQRGHAWLLSFFDEVDNSGLILFRIMWGLIMAYECWTFIRHDYNKLEAYYLRSGFYPKYYGFSWVNAWPGDGMYYHIWAMCIAGLGVATGTAYHFSCIVFFLGFTYIILLDACLYLNHFYLIAVMAFMLIFLPAHRRFSVDCLIRPSIRTTTMPQWIVYLLRFEQVVVYFYAGVAKINEDWLRGEPIRHWIPGRALHSYDRDSMASYMLTVSTWVGGERGICD